MQTRYTILSVTAPLLILLIIGSYLYLSQPPELKVQEGYDTLHLPYYSSSLHEPNKILYARTIINSVNILNFSIYIGYFNIGNLSHRGEHILIIIDLAASTQFKEDLKIDYFEFRAVELGGVNATDNTQNFQLSSIKKENLTAWPESMCNYGSWGTEPIYSGFDANGKNFTVQEEILWEIPHHNYGNNYTLRVQAILGMYGQRIPATIDIELSGFAEGEE